VYKYLLSHRTPLLVGTGVDITDALFKALLTHQITVVIVRLSVPSIADACLSIRRCRSERAASYAVIRSSKEDWRVLGGSAIVIAGRRLTDPAFSARLCSFRLRPPRRFRPPGAILRLPAGVWPRPAGAATRPEIHDRIGVWSAVRQTERRHHLHIPVRWDEHSNAWTRPSGVAMGWAGGQSPGGPPLQCQWGHLDIKH